MKPAFAINSLILLMFFTATAQAQHLTKLGERLSTCKNLETDDYIIQYDDNLAPEAQSLFTSDKLHTALVNADNCFRIGTELKLQLAKGDSPYLGRGLLEEMKIVSKSQLASDSLNEFSKNATGSFVKSNSARDYAILRFKVTEKIEEAYTNEKYKRLPSCFPSYSDWEAIPLDQTEASDIKAGKTKALIWNGTFNCYKVGIYTEISVKQENRPETSGGYIIPTELFLVHYTNLNQKHADLLGESLSKLKDKLAQKKDVDGGWVSMVAFDYQEIHPKDLPPSEEDQTPEEQ